MQWFSPIFVPQAHLWVHENFTQSLKLSYSWASKCNKLLDLAQITLTWRKMIDYKVVKKNCIDVKVIILSQPYNVPQARQLRCIIHIAVGLSFEIMSHLWFRLCSSLDRLDALHCTQFCSI